VWLFAPGATYGSAKSWPLDRAVEFAAEAIEQRKIRLVVVGDSAASDFARKLAKALSISPENELPGQAGLVDLTGKTDLPQVVSLMKSCEVFVGIDSGLMHLAAALGVATVGIFGSSNPRWTSPRGAKTKVVTAEGFDCRPCYLKTCNQKEFCLDTVGADRIFSAIDELLIPGEQ
jgi:heptosyltransferase-2